MMRRIGQGATEYLVLLAVVLIVALVSVALLGFFPGMASDAQITQSDAYWKSMQPIAILESSANYRGSSDGSVFPYMRLRNNGAYPVRITGIIGADGNKADQFFTNPAQCGAATGSNNISNFFYLGPGEETYFSGNTGVYGTQCDRRLWAVTTGSAGSNVGGASSVCQNSSTSPGFVTYKTFGFEYIEYLDNAQQITKREISSKPLTIRCREPN